MQQDLIMSDTTLTRMPDSVQHGDSNTLLLVR